MDRATLEIQSRPEHPVDSYRHLRRRTRPALLSSVKNLRDGLLRQPPTATRTTLRNYWLGLDTPKPLDNDRSLKGQPRPDRPAHGFTLFEVEANKPLDR